MERIRTWHCKRKLVPFLSTIFLVCCGDQARQKKVVPQSAAKVVVKKTTEEVVLPKSDPPPPPKPALLNGRSISKGSPVAGSVVDAAQLPLRGLGYRHNPNRSRDAAWGTVAMLNTLIETAFEVTRAYEGATLTINDVGLKEGGPIPHHGSHQAGRDVDTLFYMRRVDNKERFPSVGAFFDTELRGVDFADLSDPDDDVLLELDLAENWQFIESLLSPARKTRVQRIFVVEHIRAALIKYAQENNGDADAQERFSNITCQPSYPHDDHFHIRFFCQPEDIKKGCRDSAPIYPWHHAYLESQNAKARQASGKRFKSEVTTEKQAIKKAKKKAGKLDANVRAWLKKRRGWFEQPHPGRTYCR